MSSLAPSCFLNRSKRQSNDFTFTIMKVPIAPDNLMADSISKE